MAEAPKNFSESSVPGIPPAFPISAVQLIAESVQDLIEQEIDHPGILSPEQVEEIEKINGEGTFCAGQPDAEWLHFSQPQTGPDPAAVPDPAIQECGVSCEIPPPPTEPIELHNWAQANQESIAEAKKLPNLPLPKLLPGSLGTTRPLPREYEFLTLDGKIVYAQKFGEHIFDSNLHYEDGRSAAVGLNNKPLTDDLKDFGMDKQGQVVRYKDTTRHDLEEWRQRQPDETTERKKKFKELQTKWNHMETAVKVEKAEAKKLGAMEKATKGKRIIA